VICQQFISRPFIDQLGPKLLTITGREILADPPTTTNLFV
jgi:hypothetical protein